LNKIMSFEKL